MDVALDTLSSKRLFSMSVTLCVHVHRYAASIDDILEEEEHYADQLKEYLFYTDAVR